MRFARCLPYWFPLVLIGTHADLRIAREIFATLGGIIGGGGGHDGGHGELGTPTMGGGGGVVDEELLSISTSRSDRTRSERANAARQARVGGDLLGVRR